MHFIILALRKSKGKDRFHHLCSHLEILRPPCFARRPQDDDFVVNSPQTRTATTRPPSPILGAAGVGRAHDRGSPTTAVRWPRPIRDRSPCRRGRTGRGACPCAPADRTPARPSPPFHPFPHRRPPAPRRSEFLFPIPLFRGRDRRAWRFPPRAARGYWSARASTESSARVRRRSAPRSDRRSSPATRARSRSAS